MLNPVVLFNEPNRVFLDSHQGKIGKDGKITLQKGQKGGTCRYYAMKKLLKTEQIRSEHGRLCSKRRKMVTEGGANVSSAHEYHKAREKANIAFFQAKGLDPKKAAQDFWIDTMKKGMAEVPSEHMNPAMLAGVIQQQDQLLSKVKPWYQLERMEAAADQLMAKGYGLKEVSLEEIGSMKGLIQTLQKKGRLMITGRFGKHFYGDRNALKLDGKIGNHFLYGWTKGTPTTEGIGVTHAIVIIGAEVRVNEKKEEKQFVYWIDPADPSDPANPDSERVYVSSFEAITNRMTTLEGMPLSMMSPQSRKIVGGALYNPLYFQTQ
jgi:hypothetical protein